MSRRFFTSGTLFMASISASIFGLL
jgi:hypothetical protein